MKNKFKNNDLLSIKQSELKKKRAKTKKKRIFIYLSFSLVIILAVVMLSFVFFGQRAKVKNITVTNDSFFSSSNIISKSGLSYDSNYYFLISGNIINNFKDWEIVDVKINKLAGFTVNIELVNKDLLGYYSVNDKYYLLGSDKIYDYKDDYALALSQLPFIVGFENDLTDLTKALSGLDSSVLQQISEINKAPTSYDENMIKLTMIDGNYAFINYFSFHLLNNYNKISNSVIIDNACIYFDELTEAAHAQLCDDLN
ncbi:MAG: hypothetical protein ACK5G7_02400 [Erysipelotrichaceae bacterium]